jgi:ribonuclease-3
MRERLVYEKLYELSGHYFNDSQLLELALTHRSAAKKHNERLEYLGDAVLGMVIAEALFERFPQVPEGKLTRMRATLVKGETLAKVAKQLDLGAYIKLGSGEKKTGGSRRESILADATEAFLGAVYRDSDFDTVKEVIIKLFKPRIDKLDPDHHPKDSKTQLQEWLQARKQALPMYTVIATEGKDHAQTFTVSCSIEGQNTTQGTASSRRKAEQESAKLMLGVLLND